MDNPSYAVTRPFSSLVPEHDYDEGEFPLLSPPNVTRSVFKIYSPGYYVADAIIFFNEKSWRISLL